MLLGCLEICGNAGSRGNKEAFDLLVSYIGRRLGLHSEKLPMSDEQLRELDAGLDLNLLKAVIDDHLGRLFCGLELGGDKLGQFLTPSPVANMMSTILAVEELKPGQRILDPCMGTGGLLIAGLKHARRGVEFYGIEIDRAVYRVALVQFSLYTDKGATHPFHFINSNALIPVEQLPWHTANKW